MRRRLICFALCLLMVLSVSMVGCGKKEETDTTSEEASARPAVSLNMWVISDIEVSPETEKMVEDAFNAITKTKFTTQVDFRFFTEDEYYAELDKALGYAYDNKLSSGEDVYFEMEGEEAAETVATEPEREYNEYGQLVLSYPEIPDTQIDIVFISGKDMHDRYVSEGKIQSVETNLNASSKVLKDYIYPTLLESAKVNNNTYAIPNNHLVGEYTFLLINKEMAEKYYIDTDNINTFANCADLINDIGTNEDIPAVLEYVNPVNLQYWLDYELDSLGVTDKYVTFKVGSAEFDVAGEVQNAPVAPVMNGDTLMLPVQFFAKAMGGTYSFDSEASVATVTYGARDIVITPDSAKATVLGNEVALAAPVYFEELSETDKVLMAPADFLVDSLCANYTVDGDGVYTVMFNEYNGMSLLVTSYGASDDTPKLSMASIFSNENFTKHMLLMKKCEENGWFAENPAETDEFGVAIITGGYEVYEQYQDKYDVKVLSYPTITEETVYESMFAVSSCTASLDRSMEIITFINTDPVAKNILQYGVEGVHYKFEDDGTFTVTSDDYRMNNLYTGNMFLAYTTEDVPADIWDTQKTSNLDSRTSPFYSFATKWADVDVTFFDALGALSNDYFDRMADCTTEAELSEFFTASKKELDANPIYASALNRGDDSNSPYAVYYRWGLANKYWTED